MDRCANDNGGDGNDGDDDSNNDDVDDEHTGCPVLSAVRLQVPARPGGRPGGDHLPCVHPGNLSARDEARLWGRPAGHRHTGAASREINIGGPNYIYCVGGGREEGGGGGTGQGKKTLKHFVLEGGPKGEAVNAILNTERITASTCYSASNGPAGVTLLP